MTKSQLLETAKALPPEERIDLAMSLWDTLDPADAGVRTSAALREELRRRVDLDAADPQPIESWTELRSKLLRGEL